MRTPLPDRRHPPAPGWRARCAGPVTCVAARLVVLGALVAAGCASAVDPARVAAPPTAGPPPGPAETAPPVAAPKAGYELVRDAVRAVDRIDRMRIVLRARRDKVDPVADAPTVRCYQGIVTASGVLHAEATAAVDSIEAALRLGDRTAAENAWQLARIHEQTVVFWIDNGCAEGIARRRDGDSLGR